MSATADTTAGKIDTLQFRPNVSPGDVTFSSSSTALIIKLASGDQITVNSAMECAEPRAAGKPGVIRRSWFSASMLGIGFAAIEPNNMTHGSIAPPKRLAA